MLGDRELARFQIGFDTVDKITTTHEMGQKGARTTTNIKYSPMGMHGLDDAELTTHSNTTGEVIEMVKERDRGIGVRDVPLALVISTDRSRAWTWIRETEAAQCAVSKREDLLGNGVVGDRCPRLAV